MLFDVPEGLKGIGYYQGISLILWILVIILLLISVCLFAIKAFKTEEGKGLRMMLIAYSVFCLFYGLTRIIYIIAVYNPPNYDFFVILGFLFMLLGIIYWLFILETYIIKFTKKIITIINLIGFVIGLITLSGYFIFAISEMLIWRIIIYTLGSVSIGIIMIIYVYLIIKTTGTPRKKAIGILVGLILVYITNIMDSEFFISTFTIHLVITPIIMIIGIIIFTGSQLYLKKNE